MGGLIQRIKIWWQGADRTQKLIAICGSGIFVALLLTTFLFASKPKMSLVFTNLDPEDTGSVAMEIENMGIACDYDQNGNVKVPSDKVAQVRAGLAMKGKLPKPGHNFGSDAFSKLSFISDPKVQEQQLKAIEESELSEAIQVFDGVAGANVQVTPAEDTAFESEKKPAAANVTVSEATGSMISSDEARAMANLVASSVPGLDTSKVTIFTRSGRALWDGQDMVNGTGPGINKLDLEKQESRKRRDELQETLNKVLGQGNAIAMVDVSLDMDSYHEDSNKPGKKPLSSTTISENLKTNATGAGGQPPAGLTTNLPTASAGAAGNSNSGYTVTQSHVDNPPETVVRSGDHVPGDIKSMAITVLVNNTDPATIKSVQDLTKGYLGSRATDPNFTASVVPTKFDTTQADAAKTAESASASSSRMAQILSILPMVALIAVAFFVIKAMGKFANRPMPAMLAMASGGPGLPMSGQGGQMFASSLPSAHSKALESANRFVLPEIVKQKALEAGISEEQLQAAIEEAGEAGISVDDIPSIKNKVNVPLEQIKKMASERPETVAMMIKSWLIEEGIRR